MAPLDPAIEIERIRNLIINFGWQIQKQEIKDDEIVLKVVKEIPKPVSLSPGAS